MAKSDGHRAQHRERFRKSGMQDMTDAEALELLLSYTSTADEDALAHRLLERFDSLSGLFSASEEELCGVEGLNESATLLLTTLIPLWQKMNLSAPCSNIFEDTAGIGDYFCALLSGIRNEQLFAAMFNASGDLIYCRRMREGNSGAVDLDLRDLAESASRFKASYVVLAHNHPSGVATPSKADISTTSRAAAALAPYNIRLFDHIVVADNDFVSMRQSGLLKT